MTYQNCMHMNSTRPKPNSELYHDSSDSPASDSYKLKIFHYKHVAQRKNDIPYERICSALSTMRFPDQIVYVQIWASIDFKSASVLTTRGQPFGLSMCTNEFSSYRIACLDHNSYVNHNNGVCIGLPGHVLLTQSPEWIQDVSNYNDRQYPQLQDALYSNIRRSFAVPLSEGDRRYGVLEVAMTGFKDTCSDEMREVCRALKEEGFKSSYNQNESISVYKIEYSPETHIVTRSSKSDKITCNDITKLLGLPKEAAAKRCNLSSNSFTTLHQRYGIDEWPRIRRGTVKSYAHTALVHGEAYDIIEYKVAQQIEDVYSRLMQDNDDINCEANLVDKHMDYLYSDAIVGNSVREQLDEGASTILLEHYYHKNKRSRN